MKKFIIIISFFLVSTILLAQTNKQNVKWNGYGQFRLYKINNVSEGFMVRRAKLWVEGNVPTNTSFSYKAMGIFSYNHSGYLGLLDAYGDYNFSSGYLRFGQQIPEFSLQRLQPDWKIPVIERSAVVNRMIPSAQSFGRDIGLQIHLFPIKNVWQISAGFFNGNGANLKIQNSENFLYTLKSSVKINFAKHYYLHLGGSVMFRKAEQYDFSLIFGKNNLYSGNDFRYGLEALLNLNKFEIQAEYITADFKGQKAYGYYAFVNYNLTNKDQLVLSTEQLIDLNETTIDDPWLNAGYNHLFAKHNVKLMARGGTQFNDNYTLTTQIQLFFN